MIFDLYNESSDVMDDVDVLASVEEADCGNLEDPMLVSALVGIKADSVYNKLIEATAIAELNVVQETGSTVIYENAAIDRIKAFFEKLKEGIKTIAKYIKAFFEKVFKMLRGLFEDGARFVKDNRDLVTAGYEANKDKEFVGFRFNYAKLFTGAFDMHKASPLEDLDSGKVIAQAQAPKFVTEQIKSIYNTTDIGLIRQACYSAYRSSKNDHIIDLVVNKNAVFVTNKSSFKISEVYPNVGELLTVIESYSSAKKAVDINYKQANTDLNNAIKAVDEMKKNVIEIANSTEDTNKAKVENLVKDYNDEIKNSNTLKEIKTGDQLVDKAMSAASKHTAVIKELIKINNAMHSEHVSALKAAHSQALSVARKLAVKGGSDKKVKSYVKKESVDFLSDIEF